MKSKSRQNSGRDGCFVLVARFTDNRMALGTLRVEPFGPPGRFSAWLAATGWCARLRQNRRHDPTHLLWSQRTVLAFPGSVQGLSQFSCQIELVEDHSY